MRSGETLRNYVFPRFPRRWDAADATEVESSTAGVDADAAPVFPTS